MDSFNYENVIDADFKEQKEKELLKDKSISKEILYYTRIQVAKILNEKESVISYWSKEFQPILNLKIINMTRKYTKKDVENLLFIQRLIRENGMSIKQVLQYCSEKGFSLENKTLEDNPLAIKTFISAMTDEFDKKITEMKDQIIFQQQEMIQNLQSIIIKNNMDIKTEISLTVDDVLTEKLNDMGTLITEQNDNIISKIDEQNEIAITKIDETINAKIDQLEANATARDVDLISKLQSKLDEHKQSYEEESIVKEEKKGFFSKLFK